MKRKILIVEDELDLCDILTEVLRDQGWETTATQTLEGAYHLLDQQSWDFLLIDFHLAYTTTTALLEMNQKKNGTPVVLMTGAPAVETQLISSDLFKHLLIKPFSIRQLIDILSE